MKIIRLAKILALPAIAAMVTSAANGQIYSQNIVGYINLGLYSGTNYIANQLDNGEGNTLDTLFTASSSTTAVPEGTMFTEWNPTTDQFLPVSTYDTVNGWSINYALTYGEGGMLVTPMLFSNAFVGSVSSALTDIPGQSGVFTPPLVTGTGLQLLSCVVPFDDATFYDVVGRDPQNGEYVTMFDAADQSVTTTTFEDGAWNNGTPELDVGESAFFYLEPVPEPSAVALASLGAVGLWMWRRPVRSAPRLAAQQA